MPIGMWLSRNSSLAAAAEGASPDRKSTRLNSSHLVISYAVFCLKKKKKAARGVTLSCRGRNQVVRTVALGLYHTIECCDCTTPHVLVRVSHRSVCVKRQVPEHAR